MSKSIDEKIVEMRFDNSDFEKNVKESMSTLDKLKAKLEFKGAKHGIEEVAEASEKLDFKNTADGIEKVALKFDAMYRIASKVFDKLTDQAINLVKSMSVDNIISGFNKYEEKTQAVQTIMAATGKSIDEVNEQLELLAWFTDETSYSFTDMVSNIGKFTSSGVALESAVASMQGIATWAAISGQNAQAASRAMYNLSQALGTGVVMVKDWASIENANMATKDFKENVLEAAAAVGVLTKKGKDAEGTMQYLFGGEQINYKNFRDSLSKKWFNKDVLEAVLAEYGSYASMVKTIQDRNEDIYDTASQTMQEIEVFMESEKIKKTEEDMDKLASKFHLNNEEAEVLIDTYHSVGRAAFAAAQEAKTWSDVVGSVKDAVSSYWMRIFENIFGDYQDAKVLFTDMANELWNIFAGPISDLNDEIAAAFSHKDVWKDFLANLAEADISASKLEDTLKEVTNGEVFNYRGVEYDLEGLIKKIGSLEKVTERGYITTDMLNDALSKLGQDGMEGLERLTEKGGRIKLIESFSSIYRFINGIEEGVDEIKGIIPAIKEAWTNIFPTSLAERLSVFIDRFHEFATSLKMTKETSQAITEAFEGLFKGLRMGIQIISKIGSAIMSVINTIFPYIAGGALMVAEFISTSIGSIADLLGAAGEKISEVMDSVWKTISDSDAFKMVAGFLTNAKNEIVNFISGISEAIRTYKLEDFIRTIDLISVTIADFASSVLSSNFVQNAIGFVLGGFSEIGNFVKNFKIPTVSEFVEALKEFIISWKLLAGTPFKSIADKLKILFNTKLKNTKNNIVNWIVNAYQDTGSVLSKALNWMIDIVGRIAELVSTVVGVSVKHIYIATKNILELAQMFAAFKLMMAGSNFLNSIASKIRGESGGGGFTSAVNAVTEFIKAFGLVVAELAIITYVMGKADAATIEKGLQRLGNIMISLGALVTIMLIAARGTSKDKLHSMALNMVALGFAIEMLADALSKIQDLKFNLGGLVMLGAMMFAMYEFIKRTSGIKGGISAALPIVAMAQGLSMMLDVIRKYSQFDWEANVKGLLMIIPMMGGLILAVNTLSNSGSIKALVFVGLTLALKMLIGIVRDLATIDAGTLAKGELALLGLLVILGVFMAAVKLISSMAKGGGTITTKFVVFIGIVALLLGSVAAIALLGKIPTDELKKGTAAIAVLMAGIAAILHGIGSLSGTGTLKALVLMGGIALIMAAVSLLYTKYLANGDYTNALPAITTLAGLMTLLIAFGTAAELMGRTIDIGALLKGELILAEIAVVVGLVIAAVTAILVGISEIPNIEQKLDDAARISTKLGDLIGAFVGGIIGGLAGGTLEALASHFPAVANYLTEFSTNLAGFMSFIDDVSTEDSNKMSLFVDSLGNLLLGLEPLAKKATTLYNIPAIGTKVKEFMENLTANGSLFSGLNTVKEEHVEAAKTIAEIITSLGTIAKKDGVVQWWEGRTDFEAVGSGLVGYGKSVLNFVTLLQNGDGDTSPLPKNADQLIKEFSTVSTEIIRMYNQLPTSSSKFEEFFSGAQDWGVVTDGLTDYAVNTYEFVKEVRKHTYDQATMAKVTSFLELTSHLITSFKELPTTFGDSTVMGTKSWDSITTGLGSFTETVSKFVTDISNLGSSTNYADIGATVQGMIDTINDTITKNTSALEWTGEVLGDHLLSGMSTSMREVDGKITYFVSKIQEGFGVYRDNFIAEGASIIKRIVEGMDKKMDDIRSETVKIGAAVNTALRIGWGGESSIYNKMVAVGKYAAEGLNEGMNSWYATNLVSSGGSRLGRLAYEAAKKAIESNSPSKKFMQLGEWSAEGFNLGVTNSLSSVASTMDRLGETSLDGLRDAMSNITTAINEDARPVIRPVLDLSDVNHGMNGLLGTNYSLGIGSTTRNLTNSIKIQNGGNTVAAAITGLKEDLNAMKDEMLGMRIVMDSGALVGSISTKMDSALGTISTYKGRGNI